VSRPRLTAVRVVSADGKAPEGIKGEVFDQPLSGVDVFCGDNGTGKSTRLLAVSVAQRGLASVSTDPERPFLDGLPAHTAVELDLDTGEQLWRDVGKNRGKASTKADEQAAELLGVPPVTWDLRSFVVATPGDRKLMLERVAKAGGAIEQWDAATAIARVEALLVEGLVSPGPLEAIRLALTEPRDGAEWLEAALVQAEAAQTATNSAQKDKAAHHLELVKKTGEAPPEGDPTRAEALHLRLAQIGADRKSIETATAARDRHLAEGARLARAAADARAAVDALTAPLPPVLRDLATLRAAVAAFEVTR
jgi:hypothetical protein